MPTTRDVIARAARAAGILASGETLGAAEEQDCLAILQRFRNSLGVQRGTIYEDRRVTQGLTSGTRDYTIGTGGTINVVRPTWIPHAGIVLDDTVTDPIESEIAVLTTQQWALVAMKTLDALPSAIFYDHAFSTSQLGTISCYPTPNDSDQQLVLYLPMAVTGFEGLTTNYLFPPGYEDMYHYNLAERIAVEFHQTIPDDIHRLAALTLTDIKSANHRPVELRLDGSLPGVSGGQGSSSAAIERALTGV
mgnify:CR=1 FL=1